MRSCFANLLRTASDSSSGDAIKADTGGGGGRRVSIRGDSMRETLHLSGASVAAIDQHGKPMPTSQRRTIAALLALIGLLGRADLSIAVTTSSTRSACRLLDRVAKTYDLPGFTSAEADRAGSVLEFAIGHSANGERIAPGAKIGRAHV